jgi:hypothetical protein
VLRDPSGKSDAPARMPWMTSQDVKSRVDRHNLSGAQGEKACMVELEPLATSRPLPQPVLNVAMIDTAPNLPLLVSFSKDSPSRIINNLCI